MQSTSDKVDADSEEETKQGPKESDDKSETRVAEETKKSFVT